MNNHKEENLLVTLNLRIERLKSRLEDLKMQSVFTNYLYFKFLLSICAYIILIPLILLPYLNLSYSTELPHFIDEVCAYILVINIYLTYSLYNKIQKINIFANHVKHILEKGHGVVGRSLKLFLNRTGDNNGPRTRA